MDEIFDKYGFADDALDHCIISWSGVKGMQKDAASGSLTERDLPCDREFKLLLAEPIKGEIARMCFGRQANALLDYAEEEEERRPPEKPAQGS